jgi:phosphoglycolate phosphatase-like HAD superfamily hydrolase
MNPQTIIFDMDGVLLSQRPYWVIASAVVEKLTTPLSLTHNSQNQIDCIGTIPSSLIDAIKIRGVNSDWDLTWFVLTAVLTIGFTKQPKDTQLSIAENLNEILTSPESACSRWASSWQPANWQPDNLLSLTQKFWALPNFKNGHSVMPRWAEFLSGISPTLSTLWRSTAMRSYCQTFFDSIYDQTTNRQISLVDPTELRSLLTHLQTKGVQLGIATGRPNFDCNEGLVALGLTNIFDPARVVTYERVMETETRTHHNPLSKPHPYIVLQASAPHKVFTVEDVLRPDTTQKPWLYYVGDAGSDVLAAFSAGANARMVLTGCASPNSKEQRQQLFSEMGVTHIYSNVIDFLKSFEREVP